MPGLSFTRDGVNDDWMVFDSNDVFDAPFTVFVVAQSNVNANVTGFLGRQNASDLGSFVIRRESSGGVFNSFLFGTGGSSQVAKASNNNVNLHVVTYEEGGSLGYSLNNGGFTYGTARSGYDNSMVISAGLGASSGAGANPLDGAIYEVIIYDGIMSTDRIAQLSPYLINFWKIT
jgi:hypothetical protein